MTDTYDEPTGEPDELNVDEQIDDEPTGEPVGRINDAGQWVGP